MTDNSRNIHNRKYS